MCQAYDEDVSNKVGVTQRVDFALIDTNNKSTSVPQAAMIPFPLTGPNLDPIRRKSVFSTYHVPISTFVANGLVLTSSVTDIRFIFRGLGTTYYMIGGIELWK